MKPSDETIVKFRIAYIKEFGEEITTQQAYEKFLRLTNLLRVILKPTSKTVENPNPVVFPFDQQDQSAKVKDAPH